MNRSFFVVPLLASLVTAACSASPGSSPTSEDGVSEDVVLPDGGKLSPESCNGLPNGCGPCTYDPSSPKGGYESCLICETTIQRVCSAKPPPPHISATWSGYMWVYGHPTQGSFSVPVNFDKPGSTWLMTIPSMDIQLGAEFTLQSGKVTSGSVDGENATITIPIHASASGLSEDATITMSTEFVLADHAVQGFPHDDATGHLYMVSNSGSLEAMMQGTITAWPSP